MKAASVHDALAELRAAGCEDEAEAVERLVTALEEIADVPGRSVTSLIARRALDGNR